MRIVLLVGSGIIAPYVMTSYLRALQQEGHEVMEIMIDQGLPVEKIRDIQAFKPDFALCYGFVGLIPVLDEGFLFRYLKVPLVLLHYDNPFLDMPSQIEQELREYSEYYYYFIWDRTYLDIYRSGGLSKSSHIMLAVDEKLFYPRHDIPRKQACCFVGSIGHDLPSLPESATAKEHFIHTAIQEKLEHLDASPLEICSNLFSRGEYAFVQELLFKSPYHFWSTIYNKINKQGSPALRKKVLDSMDYVALNIYGATGWSSNANIAFHEKVEYGENLAFVYQSYSININISSFQLETAINNRPFDVFASGAFVLSDYKEDMKLLFPDHWEAVTYRNVEELQEKCEYYLGHEKERLELVVELRNLLLTEHTYRHRVRSLVETFRETCIY